MNLNKFLPLTETTYYILFSLMEPLHGYAIMQYIEELSAGNVQIAPGTLYGALEHLKQQKLISVVESEQNGRRKTYQLTELGRTVLQMEYERMAKLVEMSRICLEEIR